MRPKGTCDPIPPEIARNKKLYQIRLQQGCMDAYGAPCHACKRCTNNLVEGSEALEARMCPICQLDWHPECVMSLVAAAADLDVDPDLPNIARDILPSCAADDAERTEMDSGLHTLRTSMSGNLSSLQLVQSLCPLCEGLSSA